VSDVIRRYPLICYFLIAYAGSWVVWALFVLSLEGSGLLPFHAPSSFLVLIAIGTFSGPTVSAVVVTAATEGRAGIVRLLRRIVQWRVGLTWYLFTFVGIPAIETLGTIAIPGALASVTPIDALPELMSAAVFFVYPALLAGPLGEEIGWRVLRSLVCNNSTGP
jgi:CAAX protease family protein